MKDLRITTMTEADAGDFSRLLTADAAEYRQYFVPFPSEREGLAERLRLTKNDRYWGLWADKELAGFFMLRGFDEGFQRPSFGVYVAERFSNRGLSLLALDFSLSWCRLNNLDAVMLKVHPDNHFARKVYEKAGFLFVEACSRTGHNVMEKRWRDS